MPKVSQTDTGPHLSAFGQERGGVTWQDVWFKSSQDGWLE